MKLTYLGTAAAEAAPALFCRCDFCRYARAAGGREIRTRSGAIVDNRLKIDFGPDSYKQMLDNGLDYADVHSLLVTHTHEDHLNISDIAYRRPGFANLPADEPILTLYGNEALREKIASLPDVAVAFRRMIPFEPVMIEGYRVTALEAVHCVSHAPDAAWPVTFEGREYRRSEEALFYLIEKDGKSLLYAHDTDEFTPSDMDFLAGRKIDLVSLDCTNGRLDAQYVGHMGAHDNLRQRDRLIACGAADAHTVFVANHFSHNGLAPIESLQEMLPGFIIAYDGLSVDI